MEAIARLGAAECLRSGITTVGDLAFSGASAHACAALGLRAIVYLEVFGTDAAEAMRQFDEKRAYVAAALVGPRPARRLAARALHVLERRLPRLPRARAAARDAPEREPGRARLAAARRRAVAAARRHAAAPGRPDRDPQARRRRPARRDHGRRALRQGRRGGDRAARAARRRGRTLPALERAARLWDRAAATRSGPPACASASARTASRRCRRTTSSRSCGRCSRLRGRATSVPTRSPRPTRWSSRLSAAPGRSGSRARSDRSSPASGRISRSSPFPARRIYHGRIRPPPSSTAALRSVSWLPSSTARHDTREEGSSGTS